MTTIKYDTSKNYLTSFNESQGIMTNKKKILKNKEVKFLGYLEQGLILLLYTLLISILSKLLWFLDNESIFSSLLAILSSILLVLVVIHYLSFLIAYLLERKKTHRGKLEIDEDGITDFTEEKVKVGLPWKNILGVVISKNTITIITKRPVYFFIDTNEKEKLIKAVEKYQKDLPIIKK